MGGKTPRQEWEKVFTDGRKMPTKLVQLCDKLGIIESVVSVLPIGNSRLIVTELRVIRVDAGDKIGWQHDSHRDIIVGAELTGKTLRVREFNKDNYSIDISTGEWEG